MRTKIENSKIKTKLAKKRTILAGSRTLLSHIRTSLVFISVALAFIKLDKNNPFDVFTIILFVFSGLFLIAGIADFFLTKHMVNNLDDEIEN